MALFSLGLQQEVLRPYQVNRCDEVGDPGGCTWEEYDGELWVDFNLPVDLRFHTNSGDKPISENDVELDLGQLAGEPWRMDVATADGR